MTDGLSVQEEKIVKRLTKTGMNKKSAKILIYLASVEETTSKKMESEMRLRQPEVSISINRLKDQDWIKKREEKKEGKGRPEHVYSLKKDLNEIIDEIEEKEREKIDDIKNNLKKIDELIDEI